jgi:hypothetical protein
LIRTALTLSIIPADMQNCSYLANGTHLGLLSQSAQNIHVQTSHRPIQLTVALRTEETSAAALTRQRQLVGAWQDFAQLLAKRGTAELNSLIGQYHLKADWLILLDEKRLQAWLPADAGFYLLRQNVLRFLRPIPAPELPGGEVPDLAGRQYYSFAVDQGDQIYLLPPALLSFFGSGEASAILLGLRQLPARVADLINTAHQRGFTIEFTWMALQIVHLEPDELPGMTQKPRSTNPGLVASLLGRRSAAGQQAPAADSFSLAESQDQMAEPEPAPTPWRRLLQNRYRLLAAAIMILIIIVLAIILAHWLNPAATEQTTEPTTNNSAVQPSLTPTLRPTQPPTTASTLPQLKVTARQLNLRESPDRTSTLLLTLKTGDIVTQLGEPKDHWVKVKTAEGMVGYIYSDYVTPVTP